MDGGFIRMAIKKEVQPLTENALKQAIDRLWDIKAEQDKLDEEYKRIGGTVLATLQPKDVRQYGRLRCTIIQNMNRGISWKEEATSLARKLYPTFPEFRKYLVSLVRRHPKKPGKAFFKLTMVKTSDEEEQ
jgi:hypothetical protein